MICIQYMKMCYISINFDAKFAKISFMSKIEKIKKMVLIALGFGMATYLIMSGMAILDQDSNTTSEVHSNTVK